MNVVFVSNFLNHHQINFCDRMYEMCDRFHFIETESMPIAVSNFGYDDYSYKPYLIKAYENIENKIRGIELVIQADAAIFGANSTEYLRKRISENKLSFIFSERIWKKGIYRRFLPPIYKKVSERFLRYKLKPLYVLCASAFLPYDLSIVKFPSEKCLTWGYYPPIDRTPIEVLMKLKPTKIRILWVGRFIKLKRAKDLIKAANYLKDKGCDFQIDFIGDGLLKETYQNMIVKCKLTDCVSFLGSMSTEKVREEMKTATFIVFTSDYHEGWGAVVNEAMNSACVPIVSHAVGCAPNLITNKENGYIYKMGDATDLGHTIAYAIDNYLLNNCPQKANESILECWNGQTAADRLIETIESLKNYRIIPHFDRGPCSVGNIIPNRWFKGGTWKN